MLRMVICVRSQNGVAQFIDFDLNLLV